MATYAEIQAMNKKRAAKKKQDKLDKVAKRKKDLSDVVARGTKAREDRKITAQKKKALQGDLMGEARLAESRTARARGNIKKADRKLATAERLKGNQKLANAREKRIKKLRDMRNSGAKPSERLKEAQKNLPGYGNNKAKPVVKKLAAKKVAAKRAPGSEGFKPTNTKIGPNMGQVNKPDTPRAKKTVRKAGPSGPTMTSMGRPSTGPKPRNKDEKVNLKKRGPSRPSMTGFKKGGMVKKCRMDGIALRGKTRAKERSK